MRNIQKAAIVAVGVLSVPLLMTTSSCSTDVFDQDDYDSIVKFMSPVDSIDLHHTWELASTYTYIFPTTGTEAQQVQIFTENPLSSTSARLAGGMPVSSSGQTMLKVSVPSMLTTLYAALVKADGTYTVAEVEAGNQEVDFSNPLASDKKLSREVKPQTYTYLFEESCPQPDDYDYNDVVMRISQERVGQQQLTLKVTVVAVGADYQLAGAVRLDSVGYSDIEKVTTVDNESFNDGLPISSRYFFDDKTDLLLKGRHGEAVIELFQDAHWAMGFNLGLEYGYFTRKKYNVSTESGFGYQLKSMRSVTYNIFFKSASALDKFTMSQLDPFIVNTYNGSFWEIHTYKYKDAQSMYNYTLSTTKALPWAIMVPMENFKHTLEGTNLGFKKKGYMFGAYMTTGHSFGEWCEDHTRTLDWYLYPTNNMVY